MADEQNPKDPKYDWLYSGDNAPKEDSGDPGDPSGPEATQLISRQSADGPNGGDGTTTPAGKADNASDAGDGIEHTQVLGAQGRTSDQSESGGDKTSSFGGTYSAPDRDAPKFAEPVQPAPRSQPPSGPPKPKPPKPPSGKKRRNWWVRGILALILVWIIFLVAVPIWAWSNISKVDAEPSGDRPSDTSGTTYLLVGSDSREGLSKEQKGDLGTGSAAGQRTDTILMLHVPGGGGPNLLLSIPRDSFVDIPSHGQNKINAAYAFGGPELLVQTVEQNTGVRIDDYIEIGFTGFVDIVDAVGGIEVCPKTSVHDPKAGHLRMKKGCQDVDGHTALSYSRSRAFPLGDITRTEHQREVITQVGSKAASWSTILLPWRYFNVWKSGAESVKIGDNVGPLGMAKFGWAMKSSGSAKRCVVPFSSLGASTSAGSAVLWDEAKANALFKLVREDNTSDIACNSGEQQ
ncbi:MAG: LCP family protein [Nocardioidaceae bacterium]